MAEKNRLQRELERQREAGAAVVDLSDTNFHRAGYRFPDDLLIPAVTSYVRSRSYDPDPRGDIRAREAIAAYYAGESDGSGGAVVDPQNVLLTASTSESYSLLFNGLAEPGDNIVLPSPTYPLFEYLAGFSRLETRFYRLAPEQGFAIDLDTLREAVDERTRFVVVISPNNPTGQIASEQDLLGVLDVCERSQIYLIFDEVFSEFLYGEKGAGASVLNSGWWSLPRPADIAHSVPVFTLNGISKMFASPDLKLGWIAATGDSSRLADLTERLETVNDVFLNCSSLVQRILPSMFEHGGDFTRSMVGSLRHRRDILVQEFQKVAGIEFTVPRAGIHCPLRVTCHDPHDDEDFAVELLRAAHVYVHPGYFYGFDQFTDDVYVVTSFLQNEGSLTEGARRIGRFLSRQSRRAGSE